MSFFKFENKRVEEEYLKNLNARSVDFANLAVGAKCQVVSRMTRDNYNSISGVYFLNEVVKEGKDGTIVRFYSDKAPSILPLNKYTYKKDWWCIEMEPDEVHPMTPERLHKAYEEERGLAYEAAKKMRPLLRVKGATKPGIL